MKYEEGCGENWFELHPDFLVRISYIVTEAAVLVQLRGCGFCLHHY